MIYFKCYNDDTDWSIWVINDDQRKCLFHTCKIAQSYYNWCPSSNRKTLVGYQRDLSEDEAKQFMLEHL